MLGRVVGRVVMCDLCVHLSIHACVCVCVCVHVFRERERGSHKFEYQYAITTMCYMQGLVVPVLRNVETMNYADIEQGIMELGTKVCKHPD